MRVLLKVFFKSKLLDLRHGHPLLVFRILKQREPNVHILKQREPNVHILKQRELNVHIR